MKKNTHPNYRKVLFVDSSTGFSFVCGSTLKTDKTMVFEGVEYPVCHISISSASHPFFTGSKQLVDAEGRVDKFNKRYAAKTIEAKQPEDSSQDSSSKKPAKRK